MWDLPGPGLEPVSPALAGGFSATVPPGKPQPRILMRRERRHRGGSSLPRVAQLTSDRARSGPGRLGSTASRPALSSKEGGQKKTDQVRTLSATVHGTRGGTTNDVLCRDKKTQGRGMENVLPKRWPESSQAVPKTKSTPSVNECSFLTTSSWENYLSPPGPQL